MVDRVTTTVDSLAKIIQTLANGSMSGHLIARRDNKRILEEGEIFFVYGKIVAAKAVDRVGVDALNWMKVWKDCTFSFSPSKESKHIPILAPGLLNNPTNTVPMTSRTDTRKIPSVRKVVNESGKGAENPIFQLALPESLSPQAVPYRTETDARALQILKATEYSRLHRHLFLLVDGHRTVAELMRLTGRNIDEVTKYLRDLEKLPIIHIPQRLQPYGSLVVRTFPKQA